MEAAEDISDAHCVWRHLFEPSMKLPAGDLHWENIFMFEKRYGARESLVWCMYAPTVDDVHALGCAKQKRDRTAGKATIYFGACVAVAGNIRELRSKNGSRFDVYHAPEEGRHHAEVKYIPSPTATKNDKSELKVLLRETFGPTHLHRCPPDYHEAKDTGLI